MAKTAREILVLNSNLFSNAFLQAKEVARLNGLLSQVERMENLVIAHELIDLNKYKIFKDYFSIRTHYRLKKVKPFVFLFCKN